ncbi:unnamed protein product [Closterium sp. Naga37s-1]|nr:unnamed protein product [Closterium sp. Naga37s-1]
MGARVPPGRVVQRATRNNLAAARGAARAAPRGLQRADRLAPSAGEARAAGRVARVGTSATSPTPVGTSRRGVAGEAAQQTVQQRIVRGSDAGNLGGTREAQRDLWEHQFPPHQCRGRRLLLVRWLDMRGHGLGSQLHVIGSVLSVAMLFNRTLVIVPGSFPQADHSECQGAQRGSLDCYFFALTSTHCRKTAMRAYKEYTAKRGLEGRMPMGWLKQRRSPWWLWVAMQRRRLVAARTTARAAIAGLVHGGIESVVSRADGGSRGNGEEREDEWEAESGAVRWCGFDTKRTLESEAVVVFGCSPLLPAWAGRRYLLHLRGAAAQYAPTPMLLHFLHCSLYRSVLLCARHSSLFVGNSPPSLTPLHRIAMHTSLAVPRDRVLHGGARLWGGAYRERTVTSEVSGQLVRSNTTVLKVRSNTTVLKVRSNTTVLKVRSNTTVLKVRSNTTVLKVRSNTTVLKVRSNTTVLKVRSNTTVLKVRSNTTVLKVRSNTTVLKVRSNTTVLKVRSNTTVLKVRSNTMCTSTICRRRFKCLSPSIVPLSTVKAALQLSCPTPPSPVQVQWWRAQALRFMLRWPSPYLCHLLNRHRHRAYGMHVARGTAGALQRQQHVLSVAARLASSLGEDLRGHLLAEAVGAWAGGVVQADASQVAPPVAEPGSTAAALQARSLLLSLHEPAAAVAAGDGDGGGGVGGEVYMPRPIVSVHVRQGDKGREMRLFSFPSFVFLANRLRRLDPALHNVWLSTEMEGVVKRSSRFGNWNFFYSKVPRQKGKETMSHYLRRTGMARVVGASFANLLVSSECDYFVGVLGSNWNRLINELRLTNGRLFAGYVALNFDEW